MTDRSPAERPTACPFLAFEDDRDYRSDRPDHRHRCFAEPRPAPRAISHQELFCLGGAFGECPTFASWAAREAAAVRRPTTRRSDAAQAPRGAPAAGGRSAQGAGGGFAAVGGAYAPAPGYPASSMPSPVPDWQAPPPWIAEAAAMEAAGSVSAGAVDAPPTESPEPSGGPAGMGFDEAGETPAFLARRTPRTPQAAPFGGAAAVGDGPASGGAAAVGSAALIGAPTADDDDLGMLVAPPGGPAASGVPSPQAYPAAPASSRASPTAAGIGAAASVQPVSGRSGGAPAPPRSVPRSDELWVEQDVDVPAEDEAWEDPIEAAAAARIARASRGSTEQRPSRFGFGRAKPSSGQARPLPQRAADPSAPAWERPRSFEAYPTIKSSGRAGGGGRGVPRVLVWAGLLAIAALALFLIPPFLLGGGGGGSGATPTPSVTAEASVAPSLAPTPVPSPTPFTYKVKAGDTLSGIAAKYKVSVDDILAANPDLKDPNALQIGQVLVIPLPASSVIPDAGTPGETAVP